VVSERKGFTMKSFIEVFGLAFGRTVFTGALVLACLHVTGIRVDAAIILVLVASGDLAVAMATG